METADIIVEDWWDLAQQLISAKGMPANGDTYLTAAVLLMAREIKYNREDT